MVLRKEAPARLDVHLICDNYSSHKAPTVRKWHKDPKPFAWAKDADEILRRLAAYRDPIPAQGD
ncbi:hypothetical protein [Streptomyces hygroscopicus]|uniref:hypothetical protein n=1 Tax=Streptomyces hygroscopicus TaxID=1912 RepID=UPI0007DB1AAD|nr:hypothetical protein [Streptomyces sp. NBRC 109436]